MVDRTGGVINLSPSLPSNYQNLKMENGPTNRFVKSALLALEVFYGALPDNHKSIFAVVAERWTFYHREVPCVHAAAGCAVATGNAVFDNYAAETNRVVEVPAESFGDIR